MNLPLIYNSCQMRIMLLPFLLRGKSISEPEIYPPSFVGHGPLLSKMPAIDVSGCSKLHPWICFYSTKLLATLRCSTLFSQKIQSPHLPPPPLVCMLQTQWACKSWTSFSSPSTRSCKSFEFRHRLWWARVWRCKPCVGNQESLLPSTSAWTEPLQKAWSCHSLLMVANLRVYQLKVIGHWNWLCCLTSKWGHGTCIQTNCWPCNIHLNLKPFRTSRLPTAPRAHSSSRENKTNVLLHLSLLGRGTIFRFSWNCCFHFFLNNWKIFCHVLDTMCLLSNANSLGPVSKSRIHRLLSTCHFSPTSVQPQPSLCFLSFALNYVYVVYTYIYI